MRTIAIINRKGGCGKTTATVNIAAALGESGRRTLLLDLDPQGSASSWLVTAERTLQVDLALGAIRALERLPAAWDFVLVDCPPTLGYLASAALTGCREALVPVQPHGLDMWGIEPVMEEMDRVRQQLNTALVLAGIVVGRASRTNHAREVVASLRATYGDDVFQQTIRDSIRVPEAAMAGLAVTEFVSDAAIAADIRAVAAELVRRDPDDQDLDPVEAERASGWRGMVGRLVGSRS